MEALICPVCETSVTAGALVCGKCASDLSRNPAISVPPDPPEETLAGPAVPEPQPDAEQQAGLQAGAPEPGSGWHASATHRETSPLVLVFPWGDHPIDGDLTVGRDPDRSPLAVPLAGYVGVSRSHARFRMVGGTLSVEDVGSTNGTYVNGRRLSGAPEPLRDGDEVRFGSNLAVTVRHG